MARHPSKMDWSGKSLTSDSNRLLEKTQFTSKLLLKVIPSKKVKLLVIVVSIAFSCHHVRTTLIFIKR